MAVSAPYSQRRQLKTGRLIKFQSTRRVYGGEVVIHFAFEGKPEGPTSRAATGVCDGFTPKRYNCGSLNRVRLNHRLL